MKGFRISERLFLSMGVLLILGSLLLLKYNLSLVTLCNLHMAPGDPFAASYYSTPEHAAATPAPVSTPMPGESTKAGIYLLSPANQSTVKKPAGTQNTEVLIFKFEVYPKVTGSTFELLFKDQVISTATLPGSTDGMHAVSVPFPKPGLYQWRVKANDIISELRTVIIHD